MLRGKQEIITDGISKYLQPNTKIFVKDANIGGDIRNIIEYDSRIDDVKPATIQIAMPSSKGEPMPIHKGLSLLVSMWTDQGRLSFASKVQNVNKGMVPTVNINFPTELTKTQLRSFFRVDTSIKVIMYPMDLETLTMFEKHDSVEANEVTLLDISGGGGKISTYVQVPEGNLIVVDFSDTIIKGLTRVECKVVKCIANNDGRYTLMLAFNNITEKQQDNIVSYVFKRQIELKDIKR